MTKPRIMIVEDEFITRSDLRDKLIRMGYEVPCAVDSGEDALRIAVEIQPDLILMDISLTGEMTGIEAAERIRSSFDVPIIYITAHSDQTTVFNATSTGPFGYLIKPFNDRMLQILIEVTMYRFSTESRLKASEERYRSIAELSDDLIVIVNPDYFVEYINGAWTHYLGHSKEEITGKHLCDVISPHMIRKMQAQIRSVFISGVRQRVVEHYTDDNGEVWFDTVLIPICSKTGTVDQVIRVSRDITVQTIIGKEMEKHGLEQIEKNMEQFQILNDKIRNPLQVITLLTSFENGPNAERILREVEMIDDLVKKLDRGWLESEKVRQFLLKHYKHGDYL
ncbi:MAG TPA: response regulator [Methanospirillum sp.]|nr:response regulator [Methanospirillum sp.]